MALLSERPLQDWIDEYAESHQHPVNRFCHTVGIPMITLSVALSAGALVTSHSVVVPLGLFAVGWVLQFIGHAYERKAPEFFKDWRFLFVGLGWWMTKMRERI